MEKHFMIFIAPFGFMCPFRAMWSIHSPSNCNTHHSAFPLLRLSSARDKSLYQASALVLFVLYRSVMHHFSILCTKHPFIDQIRWVVHLCWYITPHIGVWLYIHILFPFQSFLVFKCFLFVIQDSFTQDICAPCANSGLVLFTPLGLM